MTPRRPSRWGQLLDRAAERLGQSSQIFLIGLLCACVIEIAVDWNATLREINVLRASLQQKGENYASILRQAAAAATLSYDWDEIDRLSARLFDDPEVVYVRFTDMLGNTLYDHLRPDYAHDFLQKRKEPFRKHYRHVMERDIHGVLSDPAALQKRMQESRHRDFIQRFTDAENRLIARYAAAPQEQQEQAPRTLYQDRLGDGRGGNDRSLSYALGLITGEKDDPFGVVLVAFRNERLNHDVAGKLWKGLAMTVFFVGLILVQNIMSRRAKLRLLALEQALGAAREAIRAALPETLGVGWGELGVAFAQADRVRGTVYDLRVVDERTFELLLAVPAVHGVDAAFASVVLGDLYRREAGGQADPAEVALLLLRAYEASPLRRPVELLLCRFSVDGGVRGVSAGLAPPSVITGSEVRPIALGELGEELAAQVPPGLLQGPLRPFSAQVERGALGLFCDGLPADGPRARRFTPEEALSGIAAGLGKKGAQALAEEAVGRAVKRYRKKHGEDFFALVLRYSGLR